MKRKHRRRNRAPAVVLLLLLASAPLGAQSDGGVTPPPSKDEKGKGLVTDPATPEFPALPKGWTRFGSVRFDTVNKVIEVDGYFNLQRGLLEFLACAPGVKAHETLVALGCDPRNLNVALLALGLVPKQRPKHEGDIGPIEGDRVVIFLRWKVKGEDGKEKVIEKRAEECIVNYLAEELMDPSGFVFTGSTFVPSDPEEFHRQRGPVGPGDQPPQGGKGTGGEGTSGGQAVDKPAGAQEPAKEKTGDPAGGKSGDPTGQAETPPKPKSEMIYAPLVIGQYIALVHRPFAILDNPLQLPYPDPEYGAYFEVLPPYDPDEPTEVTLIIRRPKPGEIDPKIKRMTIKMPEGDEGAGDGKAGGDGKDGGDSGGTESGGGL